jgi:predicted NUDIX family phosphoesterase
MRSIGVGGHISSIDASEESPYEQGLWRELNEEVEINSDYEQSCVGLINDDETEVGRVHLGVVHVFDVSKPLINPMESDLANAGFVRIEDVIAQIDEFETWSKICLRALF